MKNIGIWLDKEKAHIVRLEEGKVMFETIQSELDFFKPAGGSRTKSSKWGPQDVVQDSKYLEKEKHQLKKYFTRLANTVSDADALALFGPSDTNEKFSKELLNNNKSLASKIKTITKADSMTDNQIKALVKDFYSNES
jgi:stalled ribosome alternative rescue factor ArfA